MNMRIGGSPASSHAAGMSALWHDAALDDDGLPLKRLDIPTVEKKIEDLPLPEERHLVPDGYADPFARMDAAYDVAAAQMERGLKGTEFLHGKAPRVDPPLDAAPTQNEPPPEVRRNRTQKVDPAVEAHQETKTLQVELGDRSRPMDQVVKEQLRVEQQTVREIGKASTQIGGQMPDAVGTAARREAERASEALHMAESLGIPAALSPLAASQIMQAVSMPSAVANAVTMAGAAASAGEVVSVGVAQATSDEHAIVRRALRDSRRPARRVQAADDATGGETPDV
jgi:hypothetical protein